jgi:CO dehydrogenase/acetyl-CoA synthase alpha subunit
MKTLYLTYSGSICINDNMEPEPIPTKIESIRSIYLITEPTKIIYADGDKVEELYAEADDIVIMFYRNDFKHQIVVAKSAQWVENIKDYDEKEQKRKEEWAAKQADSPCCGDCEFNCKG